MWLVYMSQKGDILVRRGRYVERWSTVVLLHIQYIDHWRRVPNAKQRRDYTSPASR